MSSHYQQYLKAIAQPDKNRSVSSPTPSAIIRKPANRSISPIISSPIKPQNDPQTPSTQPRSISVTPASTAPSSVANFPQPPATPLASHPVDPIVTPTKPETIIANTSNSNSFTSEQVSAAFSMVLKLLTSAVTEHEKRPFVAILLGPDTKTVLLTQFSISTTRRAETDLARSAAEQIFFDISFEMYTRIGRVLYAASESKLKDSMLNNDNSNMSLPCRTIFNSGSREVEVVGPVSEWEAKVVQEASFWRRQQNGNDTVSKAASIRSNGTSNGHGQGERMSVVTTWTREDSEKLSSIGEDGEYKADLDIDWMKNF